MPLKIEPMREEDYLQMGKEVKEGFDDGNVFMPASLNSPSIFGSVEYAPGEDRPVGIDHKRGYIHLCKPVINFAIAQEKASLLQKIIHSDKTLTEEVVGFRTCYDVELNDYISVDDVTRPEGVLWGAEILKKWIDDFDVEAGVRECLIDVMDGYRKTYGGTGAGEFRRASSGGYLAAGDWRFFPADNSTYENLYLYVGTTVFYSNNSRLSYLINLQGHKDRLYSMIMEYVAVAPLGIRPDIASRHDQMSIAYDEIISANKNMKMVMSGMFDARAFAASYKRLSDKVYNLLVHPVSYKSNRKSVIEKLASKQGDIRAKMLGKRVDYSGRSVIKTIQPSRIHALSRVIMESIKMGLASSVLLGLTDPLEYPLNRIAMGQEIYCGGTGEFLDESPMV